MWTMMSAALSVAACQGLDARADVRLVDSVLEEVVCRNPSCCRDESRGRVRHGRSLMQTTYAEGPRMLMA